MNRENLQTLREFERLALRMTRQEPDKKSVVQVAYYLVMMATAVIGTYLVLTPFLGLVPITDYGVMSLGLAGALILLVYNLRPKPSVIDWKSVFNEIESVHALMRVVGLMIDIVERFGQVGSQGDELRGKLRSVREEVIEMMTEKLGLLRTARRYALLEQRFELAEDIKDDFLPLRDLLKRADKTVHEAKLYRASSMEG